MTRIACTTIQSHYPKSEWIIATLQLYLYIALEVDTDGTMHKTQRMTSSRPQASISEVSDDDSNHGDLSDVEVSHEEHVRTLTNRGSYKSIHKSSTSRKLIRFHLMPRVRSKKSPDRSSIASDNATVEGVRSVVSQYTQASHDTVNVSNRTKAGRESRNHPHDKKNSKTRWSKLKRLVGVKTAPDDPGAPRLSSKSTDSAERVNTDDPIANRRRVRSADDAVTYSRRPRSASVAVTSHAIETTTPAQAFEDQSICGRLDGLDILALGGAGLITLPADTALPADWTFPTYSVTGQSLYQTAPRIVAEMLWTSAGRSAPEIILEGFIPGGEDRWSVRVEQRPTDASSFASSSTVYRSQSLPGLQPADTDEFEASEDGSVRWPSHKLWDSLWGSEPQPTNMTNLDKVPKDDDDPLLNLISDCSIPIDVDEDTFVIANRAHLVVIQEIAAGPLAKGQFESALAIFARLLKGLNLIEDQNLRFLKGTVLHNIGIVEMWRGQYERALENFTLAVKERSRYLPKRHPDLVVSIVRQSVALVALGRFDEALVALEKALDMVPPVADLVRAKILNNIGVVRFLQRDLTAALPSFTTALEILRRWLDGPIRRESIVFDAATTLSNIGKLYLERQDYDLAYFVYEEALLLQTTVFRKDHDIVLNGLTNLALAKVKTRHVQKAVQILQGCLRSQNSRFGPQSASAVETTGLIGHLYASEAQYEEALQCWKTVKKWQKTQLPANHAAAIQTRAAIDKAEHTIGQTSNSGWI